MMPINFALVDLKQPVAATLVLGIVKNQPGFIADRHDAISPPGYVAVPAPCTNDGIGRALSAAFSAADMQADRDFERLLALLR